MSKIVIFGGALNPPANHHVAIVKKLAEAFDKVIIIPSGVRSEKPSTSVISPEHKKEMAKLAFQNIAGVKIDFYDLDNNIFTPHWMLNEKYRNQYPGAEIWFAVGGDIVVGGKTGDSEIQRLWQKGREIWNNLNYAVISPQDYPVSFEDLPPKNVVIGLDKLVGRSTLIRKRLAGNLPIDDLAPVPVVKYIKKHNLYR
ncbi:MAG: hypothetical protein A3B99_04475 [Candidatus Yanofskybacteria bacterium RIFCSPHIGHO2_02_FULL_44_12b]|uniref:nicotinate-nucleotide adenylyltransferase n=2 Tax=Candidatus Yanofskyibacteriota TaxID=1752733 RepID=A0A1F8GJY2_9BACT|nr:MAG: inorganic polyphosphate/ATP-NAD kinase [Candidatus Yanofskybacteria bacterium GW2011_GWA2_44_9]OGN04327.1 MAG: hypothetical protein A2659_03285 [Candidatus Yanofskybacteria bacterium RIFCSPHIGHO2_01_FULL_44_24]OGN14434.1 MAG: hypothetical protein A3B99_04475 [Candidatus Yanofskybacteria bacterium RIFCSPHIGHO2_02_FULL_44_12b]OGN25715.1 MAG: hypothetical protein A2925_00820 [Candidatus Yanofskybacteria bacterium RIFCSPLOWO2_01_FULL_44_22]